MTSISNSAAERATKPRPFSPENSSFPSTASNPSTTSNLEFPEVKDIQNDLIAVRDDVAKLTKHVYNDGGTELKKYAEKKLEAVENQMKNKPAQTLALVFLSGFAASFLFGRR